MLYQVFPSSLVSYVDGCRVQFASASLNGAAPRDKTLDSIIDELVESTDVRDTILSFEPKSLKKKRILELLKGTDDKNLRQWDS